MKSLCSHFKKINSVFFCTAATATIQAKKESCNKKNVQVARVDDGKQASVPSGVEVDIKDGKKEIDVKQTTLKDKTDDPMKAEVKVCFDKTGVCETESLTPQDEKELAVDCTSSILKEDTEQEKLIDKHTLEIASSVEGKSLDLN